MALNPNHMPFAGGTLDRASDRRKLPGFVSELDNRADRVLLPVWRGKNLIDRSPGPDQSPIAALLTGAPARHCIDHAAAVVFLGLDDERPVFAADISGMDEAAVAQLSASADFMDIRGVGPLLPRRDAQWLAYARGMAHWHRNHRFCGLCGSATHPMHGGHARRCDNADCGHEAYPRTDPAVIMLVEYRPPDGGPTLCLLGRQANWAPGVYSTLAGFVDPGESLEEAVAREIMEEAGVAVTDIEYLASQPWPFPSSIMLGFKARALSTTLDLGEDELDDAAWFTAAQLREFRDWTDDDATWRLPRRDSIARLMIDDWLAAESPSV